MIYGLVVSMQIKQNGVWVNPPANIQWRLNNQWHQVSDSSIYTLATDDDFWGFNDGQFLYIGTEEYIEIPHIIKGVEVTSYVSMFEENSTIKGVKSTNTNVTSSDSMFRGAQSTELDLRDLNLSSVTRTSYMFYYANIEKLDLSKWDTSNITSRGLMFYSATIGTIYARTQADASFFRTGTGLSTSTDIIVKG